MHVLVHFLSHYYKTVLPVEVIFDQYVYVYSAIYARPVFRI